MSFLRILSFLKLLKGGESESPKHNEKVPTTSGDVIHIHEDDWAMRFIAPLASESELQTELSQLKNHSETNFDGSGWTELYTFNVPTGRFENENISVKEVEAILAKKFPLVTHFFATASAGFDHSKRDPWGSYQTDAVCYGNSSGNFIKVEPQENIVREIWFEVGQGTAEDDRNIRWCIEEINKQVSVVIVDLFLGVQGRVSDNAFLDVYFNEMGSPN